MEEVGGGVKLSLMGEGGLAKIIFEILRHLSKSRTARRPCPTLQEARGLSYGKI